jgi:hypothetical protein
MLRDALRIWTDDRPTLLREAVGLAGLAVAIVAALYLPILA